MTYFWYSLRGRERLSHVFWPGFGVMFLYSYMVGQLNSPYVNLPGRAWTIINIGASAFAVWFVISLWMCAYRVKWEWFGHVVRAGVIIYLACFAYFYWAYAA